VRRRDFLTGTAALGIAPLLARFAQPAHADFSVPRRLLVFWQPQGTIQESFWPRATGGGLVPIDAGSLAGTTLEPLARHAADILPLRGYHDAYHRLCDEERDGQHGKGARMRLTNTCMPGESAGGISIDQEIANVLEGSTARRSLAVTGRAVGNSRGAISFRGAHQPVWPLDSPLEVYRQLFGETTTGEGTTRADALRAIRHSALDVVRGDAERLRSRLPAAERWKMEGQLEAVRSLERALGGPAPACLRETPSIPAELDTWGLLSDAQPGKHALMLRAVAAAFSCDVTRVATVMATSGGGDFDTLGYFDPAWSRVGYHGAGHEAGFLIDPYSADPMEGLPFGRAECYAMMERVARYYAQLIAETIDLLKSIPEGEGTLFDHTLIVWTNEMAHGNHGNENIPWVLCGGRWALRTGNMLDLSAAAPEPHRSPPVNMAGDILISIAHAMGHPIPTFGRADWCRGPVPEIHL
jgi:hypothetical protein